MWLLVGKNLLSVVDFLPKIILYVPNIMLPKKVFLTKYHGVQKIISRDMIQKYHFVSWYKNTMPWYKIIILYFPNIMLPKKREILLIAKKFCVRLLMGSPEVWNRCFAVCLTFDLLCYYLWPVVCSWIVCFAAPLVCCLLVSVTLGVTQGFRPTRHCCLIFVFFRGHWCFVFLKRRSLTFSDSTCLDYAGILSAKN